MISKIANYFAWVALLIVVLIKFVQFYGIISIRDLITRLILWGLGSFILIKIIGKMAEAIINLSGKEAVNLAQDATIDYTLETAYPETAVPEEVVKEESGKEPEEKEPKATEYVGR